jgi:flagellar motility protein MotE (MotC chaperone)
LTQERLRTATDRQRRLETDILDQTPEEKTKAEAVDESEKKPAFPQKHLDRDQTNRGPCEQKFRQIENSESELQLQIGHRRKLLSEPASRTRRRIWRTSKRQRTAESEMTTLMCEISKMLADFAHNTAEHGAGKIKLDQIEAEVRAKTASFEAELSQAHQVLAENNEQINSLERDRRRGG